MGRENREREKRFFWCLKRACVPADADEGVGVLVEHVLERDDDALEVARPPPLVYERERDGGGGEMIRVEMGAWSRRRTMHVSWKD